MRKGRHAIIYFILFITKSKTGRNSLGGRVGAVDLTSLELDVLGVMGSLGYIFAQMHLDVTVVSGLINILVLGAPVLLNMQVF